MDAVAILNNIYAALQPFWTAFEVMCTVVAVITGAAGLSKLQEQPGQGKSPVSGGLTLLGLAGFLAVVPTGISMLGETFVATSLSSQALSYSSSAPTPIAKAGLQVGIVLIKLVGLASIWKGIGRLKIYAVNGDPKMPPEGIAMIVAGTLCVFAPQFIRMLGNTMGGKPAELISTYI